MESFKNRIREVRKSIGLSQQELADMVNVSKQAISQYERGVRFPSPALSKEPRKQAKDGLNPWFFHALHVTPVISEITQITLFWCTMQHGMQHENQNGCLQIKKRPPRRVTP